VGPPDRTAQRPRGSLSAATAPDDRLLPPEDPSYPSAFQPARGGRAPVLTLRGRGPWPARPAVAVVGARDASPYGRRVAREVAAACARAGVCVVSGLARGIDAAAHGAALTHGGTTIAVLGTGIDRVYPAEHRRLYTAIRARGLLVTALPAGAPPRRGHFPSRNRLIAALVEGVVLVQADDRSGPAHTVRAVLAAGGWALVAPWPLGDPRYAGNARWLERRAGADRVALLTEATLAARRARAAAPAPAEDPAARLAAACAARPRPLDALARAAGLDASAAAAAALALELSGVIERAGADGYRRKAR
jgi:DNA processing protein